MDDVILRNKSKPTRNSIAIPETRASRSSSTLSSFFSPPSSPNTPTSTTTASPSFFPRPRPRDSRPSPSRVISAPQLPASATTVVSPQGLIDGYDPRESIVSIEDDPFFRNYNYQPIDELGSATYSGRLDEGRSTEPPSSSSRSLSVKETKHITLPTRNAMADINIAVIGSGGVGKSTLIQRALGLRAIPANFVSSQRMPVEGVVYMVNLIELDLESFDIDPDRRFQWPKQIGGHAVPRIDGALLLYDVMNRESIAELPQTLNALVNSSMPTILVSCKCDNPESSRQIDVESMESACLSSVEAVKTAANVPETARNCLSTMLKAIMVSRNTSGGSVSKPVGARRRAISSANLEKPLDPAIARPLSQQSKHSRASSEFSMVKGLPSPPLPSPRGQTPRHQAGRTNLHQFTIPDPHDAPPLSAHPAFRQDNFQDSSESSASSIFPQTSSPAIPSPGYGKTLEDSLVESEATDGDSPYRYSDDVPILQRGEDGFFDKPAKVAGVTFDELVERLLSQNMTRADRNFSDIFLCLYRKFAAPGELFAAILLRLEHIADDKNIHYLTRTATQLRIIAVVAKWVSNYPGDFASPTTSRNLNAFINHLSCEPVFAAAAQEMRIQLQSRVVVDDDTGWARTDADVENEMNSAAESSPSSPPPPKASILSGLDNDIGNLDLNEESTEEEIARKESTTESASSARAASPTYSITPSFHTVEDYEKEAATMVPRKTLPLTKFRYHIFMDTPEDDVADEMTRIDWVMFSSIRLRDLVRHVSLPLEIKEKSKNLANVNRMINHFNHVAKWVANMILMRDKAKHRAQMLEKFMTIALKLRQLNNYNSLAAVLAGINGSAIYRLNQTRALVPAEVHKRFYRLVMLMSPQKSHFSYRLAWENSSLPRIPFIPLTRRDLVSAEEGSRTFVGVTGDRINWKKFEVLSEVILPIMKSQVVPYPNLQKHDIARELILDCRMPTDDEEIYQRSVQLESSSGSVEPGKKKFPWFKP
ncbi:hypothetical protein BP5796_06418 [Coleophoma crateriformis]|uniref:Ras GEF n=1 Tax=Coleophoma crateriformis TaxID=565419 RepID=A0A3D8RNF2_9HELO|nr:hypothetical protein BP5796_06418 [Coleophoma crateriformis]